MIRQRNTPFLLSYAAAVVSAASAVGFTAVGAATDLDRFAAVVTDPYARSHLHASLLTGTTGFAFTAVVTALGGRLLAAGDPGMRRAGRGVLVTATLPSLISVVELLLLTPSDALHAVPFALSAALIAIALWLDQRRSALH